MSPSFDTGELPPRPGARTLGPAPAHEPAKEAAGRLIQTKTETKEWGHIHMSKGGSPQTMIRLGPSYRMYILLFASL